MCDEDVPLLSNSNITPPTPPYKNNPEFSSQSQFTTSTTTKRVSFECGKCAVAGPGLTGEESEQLAHVTDVDRVIYIQLAPNSHGAIFEQTVTESSKY
ncbi:hypothetical protein JOB18_034535 [Solea senegalensis]|uniref:Uncharacterized protein n=1 Tax=Solea senegalensis TaxID=28829 RepID=A0AAV6QEY2_SOLSE|nr:hypothetical protein JOB18_034535 [Solea senegalensis]